MEMPGSHSKWIGLLIAAAVYLSWLSHLVFWLSVDLRQINLAWIIPGILLQTWLYVGLFITGHDAMHGAMIQGRETLNLWIGRIVVFSYALFSFKTLLQRHGLHHQYPASNRDPDFHDGTHDQPLAWYLHFMRHYLTVLQLLGMALLFNLLHHLAGIAMVNLILFWVVPALLSTWQLFYFGTYLPHRQPADGYQNIHRTASSGYPVWLSLLTCYHFGYHLEHHVQPAVPWWQLPRFRYLQETD